MSEKRVSNVELSMEEQAAITGGGTIGCLASGALFAIGVFTLDPVVALGAIISGEATC